MGTIAECRATLTKENTFFSCKLVGTAMKECQTLCRSGHACDRRHHIDHEEVLTSSAQMIALVK